MLLASLQRNVKYQCTVIFLLISGVLSVIICNYWFISLCYKYGRTDDWLL